MSMLEQCNCEKRNCINYGGVEASGDGVDAKNICLAFPEGIPDKIAYGDNKHLEPVKGDSGITYEEE